MAKISLQNPNLQVRRDAFVDDKSYNEINNLMRDIKKQFQTQADVINLIYKSFSFEATPIINISSIPTSASGLTSGDVWSNAGVLTIV